MGVGALLINCIPPDHVDGMIAYLRDFTDLPLGVYPNLGYFTTAAGASTSASEATSTPRWRCAGARRARRSSAAAAASGPEHIARRARGWRARGPGTSTASCGRPRRRVRRLAGGAAPAAVERPPRAALFPLPFPELTVEPGVFVPAEPSHMTWRYLFREGIGAHQRCLDVGCGTGLLGIQLALNGAAHVLAVDIDQRAVANTLGNAFRNGVSDRLTAQVVTSTRGCRTSATSASSPASTSARPTRSARPRATAGATTGGATRSTS
jgi:hypothetical protein